MANLSKTKAGKITWYQKKDVTMFAPNAALSMAVTMVIAAIWYHQTKKNNHTIKSSQ